MVLFSKVGLVKKLFDCLNYLVFEVFEKKFKDKAGLIYMVGTSVFGSIAALFVKICSEIPSFEKTFFRAFVMFVINTSLLGYYNENPYPKDINTLKPLWLRGVVGVIGSSTYIYAVSTITLSEALVLIYTAPI